jgi:hypothetical protein
VLLVLAVVVGLLVGSYAGDHSLREWLLSFGGSAEAFGLLLVAAPELVPILQSIGSAVVGSWLRMKALLRKAERAVRRLLHRPSGQVVSAGGALATAAGMSARGRVGPKEGATLEEKVEYLLRRDEDVQDRLEEVHHSLESMPARWRADISEASETLRSEHTRALEQMRDRHLKARLLGVALLLIGIGLATAGNLV